MRALRSTGLRLGTTTPKRHVLVPLLACLTMALCTAEQAEGHDQVPDTPLYPFEATLFVASTSDGEFEDPVTGDSLGVDDSDSFGFVLAYAADEPGGRYELFYGNQSTEVDGTANLDLRIQYLQIGGSLDLFAEQRPFMPFISGGFGATLLQPDRSDFDDETRFSASLAAGFRVPLGDRFAIRLEARALFTFLDSDSSIFCVSSQGATCSIRVRSDTFTQYTTSLGVTANF